MYNAGVEREVVAGLVKNHAIIAGVFVWGALWVSPGSVLADEAAMQSTSTAVTTPTISVEADSFEVRIDEEIAVWRGSVVANQGATTFHTSSLTLRLDQLESGPGKSSGNEGDSEQLANQYELSAEKLTFDVANNVIAGVGNSMLRRGDEIIAADRIRYEVDERVAYALPEKGGRVHVQFYANGNNPLFPSLVSVVTPGHIAPASR